MRTPYFITNKNEYENILKPFLLEWGYEPFCNLNWALSDKLVLNSCGNFGELYVYQTLDTTNEDRYLETDIYQFLKTAAELMRKEYKPFLGDRDVIWCQTEELANQVLEMANKLGYSWSTGKSFKEYSNWNTYKGETCYFIHDGTFSPRSFYQRYNCNIIPAEEFIKFYKEYLNMEEKRNITISLEEAKKWYESGNATLKELALKAYSKEELEYVNFNQILSEVPFTTPKYYVVPDCEDRKWSVIHKLSTIAQYFNSRCIKSDFQYFIKGKYENEIQIGKHVGVRYPGIVYFNRPEDLDKAIKLIGEDIKYLF